MSKPRVLIIENSTDVTGALNAALISSTYLSDEFDFIFILPTGSRACEAVRAKGFPVHQLPMKELRKNLFTFVLYVPVLLLNVLRLRQIIRTQRIDFTVCNDFYNLLPPVANMFLSKKKYICYVRFLPSRFPTLLLKLWFGLHNRYAEKIIAVSESVKKQLPTSQNVTVIYSELPNEEITYIAADSSVILYPSNYIRGKGHEYAIKAFARIGDQFPDWILKFVGSDMGLEKNRRYKDELQAIIETNRVQKQVRMEEFKPNLKNDYLNAAIVLNFSDSESFSMTCLEASYYGRPVIATRCGGPDEIIDDQITGLLVPVGDVDAMARSLVVLLKDADFRLEMGKRGYLTVRKKFALQYTAERLRSVYSEHIR